MSNIHIDKLIRTQRRTIGLHITSDAKLIVRAPLFTPEDSIYKLIERKEAWIKSKQEYFRIRQPKTCPRRFIPGEKYLFLGKEYSLVAVEDIPKAVILAGSLMISKMVLNNAKEHLTNWYKTQAYEHICQQVEYYAHITALTYRSIKVNDAKTRWGSCGALDTLNFTWRLIMAPPRVIDYVVVHELMHLKQKNHSRHFWKEVSSIIPDYKQDQAWLKENTHFLTWP
ncbi:MAG: M48 family metallopeptidase [Candidatus Omnitrophica bacterium]|nr:M48 family metallopeptidase [Candidatus Omnitrophota bacterium]